MHVLEGMLHVEVRRGGRGRTAIVANVERRELGVVRGVRGAVVFHV